MNLENSNNHDNKKKAQFGLVQYVIKSAFFEVYFELDCFRIYVVEFENMNYMKFSCFCNLYAIGLT